MRNSESFVDIIWRGKWIIIAITSVFAISAVIYALSLPDKYKADMFLAPSTSSSDSGLAGLASQFGGIASLAGISMPTGQGNKVGEAMALLKSRSFIQEFIENRQLLPELLAGAGMNSNSKLLDLDETKYDLSSETWIRTAPKNKAVIPTAWEGFAVFIDMLDIGELDKDGTLRISIESESPVLAKRWLEWLVDDLNSNIAERELAEAKRSIIYLHQQIENTQLQELHSIFYSLIEEQTKKIMLGEVREDFVFKVLAAPVFPEEKSGPSRALICIGFTFFGGVLSLFLVLVIHIFRLPPSDVSAVGS